MKYIDEFGLSASESNLSLAGVLALSLPVAETVITAAVIELFLIPIVAIVTLTSGIPSKEQQAEQERRLKANATSSEDEMPSPEEIKNKTKQHDKEVDNATTTVGQPIVPPKTLDPEVNPPQPISIVDKAKFILIGIGKVLGKDPGGN